MISDKKRLQIDNICYASVSSQFAMFTNPKFRGPNFTWSQWIEDCEEMAEEWMFIHSVRGNKQTINETARQYSREIAELLVKRAELVDQIREDIPQGFGTKYLWIAVDSALEALGDIE